MTRVSFYRSKTRGGYRGFTAEGHAEAVGRDEYSMICAAVSVLTDTGVNALERVARVVPVVSEGDGSLACFLPEGLDDERWNLAQTILRTIESGLSDIAKQYPKQVKLQEK